MQAEIITIGEELLIGQIVNSNAAWIAEQLNGAGIDVRQISVVSDAESEILRMLSDAFERSDLLILTGGLGPTRDDVTKVALCRFFNTNLVLNNEVLEDIKALFSRRNIGLSELNRQQAMVPEGALVLRNKNGTAPGLWFQRQQKTCVAMPGVPFEMKAIMEDCVLPELKKRPQQKFIIHRTILTQGIGESFLSEIIANWENNLHPFIKLAYLPSAGQVRLRLSASGTNESALRNALALEEEKLLKLIPQYVWGSDNQTLEQVAGGLLKEKKLTVSTAESCTGGFLAHKITSVAGSSVYFKGSIVAYSNELKTNLLGVKKSLLKKHGAVSRQVVEVMAQKGCQIMEADFCLATSGIAGPAGGTPDKPVGMVWIALASKHEVWSKLLYLGDQRERNIARAGMAALALLREKLISMY